MAVTFIGPRGSGKTSVGANVAARLGWPFVDADVEIERRAGRTIREIFATDGEGGFRTLEQQVMADLLARDRLVIAAGGGAVLSPETRERLRESGPAIYLRVTPETALRRISADQTTAERRPALTDLAPLDEIKAVLRKREPLYRECASHVLDADAVDVAALALRVLTLLERDEHEEPPT